MAKGDTYKVLKDIIGGRGTVYAKKGVVVTEVSFSDPVAIVEDKSGERFPVNINSLIKL